MKGKNDERLHYTKRFSLVCEHILDVARGVKTEDYGETWKRLGLMGIYVKIFIKEGRLNELIWKKGAAQATAKNESIEDTLLDIAAYAIYGILALNDNNIDGEQATEEHLKDMAYAINERFECNKYGYKPITAYKSKCNHCGTEFISEQLETYCEPCKKVLLKQSGCS